MPGRQESELIEQMDAHGIGTDASIPQHISTILERGYAAIVDADGTPLDDDAGGSRGGKAKGGGAKGGAKGKVSGKGNGSGKCKTEEGGGGGGGGGRYVTPLPLGSALIEGLAAADEMLVRPALRAKMEVEVTRVADGHAPSDVVLKTNLSGGTERNRTHSAEALCSMISTHISLPSAFHRLKSLTPHATQLSRPNLGRCASRYTSSCPTLASWEGRMPRESEVGTTQAGSTMLPVTFRCLYVALVLMCGLSSERSPHSPRPPRSAILTDLRHTRPHAPPPSAPPRCL